MSLSGQIKDREEWYIILSYFGDLEALKTKYNFRAVEMGDNLAYTFMEKRIIGELSEEPQVIYIELPMMFQYILDQSLGQVCALRRIFEPTGFNVSGEGAIIGIVDSGIDYFHPDFRNEDGTTRILALWDQTIEGNAPQGFIDGSEYTEEKINEALAKETREEALAIVPSQDVLGHGTAITGIAAGNGRGSNGRYRGMAPRASLIIVKVGTDFTTDPPGATNAQIMIAMRYIMQKAIMMQKPVVMNIGYGSNIGLHDGQSTFERYIDGLSVVWKNNIVVGVGNQANKDSHTSGRITQNERKEVDIFVDVEQRYFLMTIVYAIEDDFELEVESPSGEKTNVLSKQVANEAFLLGSNSVLVNFTGPSVLSTNQEITIYIDRFDKSEMDTGTWRVRLIGKQILTGNYNIWGTAIDPVRRLTRFLSPDPFSTLTLPSTSRAATSVGAFDGILGQIAPFSGRGFGLNELIKPELVAPGIGVNVPTSLVTNGYATASGTSVSAAFVTGAYALCYDYGLKNRPGSYLYGERLKAFAIRSARRPLQNAPYPNAIWGYGILCVEDLLQSLKVYYNV